jgi:hypothetical protein
MQHVAVSARQFNHGRTAAVLVPSNEMSVAVSDRRSNRRAHMPGSPGMVY